VLTVLCLNAGIDRTYEINDFAVGGYFRPQRARINAGGKGINVARVAHRLGLETIVSGFAGGSGGAFISRQLNAEGVLTDFVPVEEEPRVCINVINRAAKTQTQIDEVGPLATPSEIERLRRKWRELLAKSSAAVLSGSAPRGVPYNIYAEFVSMARQARVPAILDARDEYLAEGIKGLPQVVKPNTDELSELLDRPIQDSNEALAGGQELVARGVGIVLVSLGARGVAAATRKHGQWLATPPKIDQVSSVGSGDALVAGFIAASLGGRGFEECLCWGVAAGAANAATFGNAFCTREQIMELVPQVKTSRLDQLGDPSAGIMEQPV
jgi:1-phosphofructokinase family hexose kinase